MKTKIPCPGFTLIEIMVSLLILMIVGIMTSAGMNFIARSKDHIEQKAEVIDSIQSTFLTIENDLRQLRPFAGLPALTLSNAYLQMSCSGLMTGILRPSPGDPLTITYQLIDHSLIRFSRQFSLNASGSVPDFQTLLSGVHAFRYRMIPEINPLTHPSDPSLQNRIIPTGIVIDIEMSGYGYVKRVIPLAINTTETEPHATLLTG